MRHNFAKVGPEYATSLIFRLTRLNIDYVPNTFNMKNYKEVG